MSEGSSDDGVSDEEFEKLQLMLNSGIRITKEKAELLVKNLDHLHTSCRRNLYLMPNRNSAIITRDYCHGVSASQKHLFSVCSWSGWSCSQRICSCLC